MQNNQDAQQAWKAYIQKELKIVTPLLRELGFELDEYQPNIIGEKYLMKAITTASGPKLTLFGKQLSSDERVVIKITNDRAGMREITEERQDEQFLEKINFAYETFLSPEEILFTKKRGYLISVHAFINTKCSFLERPAEEQFALALKAFKAQESAHATTYGHTRAIKAVFETFTAQDYLNKFTEFKTNIENTIRDTQVEKTLEKAETFLKENKDTINQYGGFLTHTDFVPHNFRVVGEDIYLLDHSSFRFGNKYEGWARFINFMALHNPELEQALLFYVRENRTPEESLSLKLMRVYRLAEIMYTYVEKLPKTTGDLQILTRARVFFWADVLAAVLKDALVSEDILKKYRETRDTLRSKEEKERQIGLH